MVFEPDLPLGPSPRWRAKACAPMKADQAGPRLGPAVRGIRLEPIMSFRERGRKVAEPGPRSCPLSRKSLIWFSPYQGRGAG
jgi:hypothetical protein